tara:strand:+ start:262 stop:534 length:273 start_codon:yes stop_codon:yes gene_type:complete
MSQPKNIDLTEKLRITLKDVIMLFTFLSVVVTGWIRMENANAVQNVQITQLQEEVKINAVDVKDIDGDLDEIKEGMYKILGELGAKKQRE